jgi:DNA-binding transcriptional LysR family regulator
MTAPLDLQTLRVIVAVAECGSISAGSDRLGIAVAAASARISVLESALGIRVFERSSRGVALTPAGRMLVRRGGDLLTDADRLSADLRDWSRGLAGHVRMLANASALMQVLPARLDAFMRAHPRILVEVEERMSPQIVGELLEGRADVGVVDMPTPAQGLSFVPFFRDTLSLVVPRGHVLADGAGELRLSQLLDENFIVLSGANALSTRLFNAAASVGRVPKVRLQMRSFDAACRMVAAGLGVAVLPRAAIEPQLAHLPITALPIAEDWAHRTHHLVLRTGPETPAAAKTLVDTLRVQGNQEF